MNKNFEKEWKGIKLAEKLSKEDWCYRAYERRDINDPLLIGVSIETSYWFEHKFNVEYFFSLAKEVLKDENIILVKNDRWSKELKYGEFSVRIEES